MIDLQSQEALLDHLYAGRWLLREGGHVVAVWEQRRGALPKEKSVGKLTKNGYLMARGTVNGLISYVMLHRLIYCWVNQIRLRDIEGMTINHINCIRSDNRPENLEAVSQKENMAHMVRLGRANPIKGSQHFRCKLSDEDVVQIREMVQSGMLQKDVAFQFGVRPNQVSRICSGKRRSANAQETVE
jgi:HNH endonuclease